MDYKLKSIDGDQFLIFSWDTKTGEISGPGKLVIENLMKQEEIVTPPPSPKLFEIPDVITDTDMMALLLGDEWTIPEDWTDYYGQRVSDEDVI